MSAPPSSVGINARRASIASNRELPRPRPARPFTSTANGTEQRRASDAGPKTDPPPPKPTASSFGEKRSAFDQSQSKPSDSQPVSRSFELSKGAPRVPPVMSKRGNLFQSAPNEPIAPSKGLAALMAKAVPVPRSSVPKTNLMARPPRASLEPPALNPHLTDWRSETRARLETALSRGPSFRCRGIQPVVVPESTITEDSADESVPNEGPVLLPPQPLQSRRPAVSRSHSLGSARPPLRRRQSGFMFDPDAQDAKKQLAASHFSSSLKELQLRHTTGTRPSPR
eukprot:Protomagalhaensia_wolfi_Nauph_80__339@NODE_1189_length_1667_cov_148_170147_g913_i0_p1_GENE_NODE_1189_length_1667_cov_148_170147_g913_i0NODE_1189_length_1667_cov_148_170147_g913_i0_p1_ORF_typecomplete_len283_score49_33_NODE_1189_length_1667_cov_148_170147_g913_i02151063